MDISIQLQGVPEVIEALKGVPMGARWAIHHAIKDSLDTAKTEITRAIRERYNVPYGIVLAATGRPNVSGLTGWLEVKGSRVPLYLFPHRDIYPFGVAVQELQEGIPINLLHAFTPGNKGQRGNSRMKIYQREESGAPRLPIRWIMGLSVPEMAGETQHIQPRVEKAMEEQYYNRIEHYIQQFLRGNLIPGYRLKKP